MAAWVLGRGRDIFTWCCIGWAKSVAVKHAGRVVEVAIEHIGTIVFMAIFSFSVSREARRLRCWSWASASISEETKRQQKNAKA
jgi:hypothetical protein